MKFKLGCGDAGVKRYVNLRKSMVPKCMRMFMVEAYRQVTISTPVDTGRARYSWNCSIGSKDASVPPEGTYSLDYMRANGVFTVQSVNGKDTLYITNNVPYIGRLNDGYSNQAPARFVQLSFETAIDKLNKYITAHGYDME